MSLFLAVVVEGVRQFFCALDGGLGWPGRYGGGSCFSVALNAGRPLRPAKRLQKQRIPPAFGRAVIYGEQMTRTMVAAVTPKDASFHISSDLSTLCVVPHGQSVPPAVKCAGNDRALSKCLEVCLSGSKCMLATRDDDDYWFLELDFGEGSRPGTPREIGWRCRESRRNPNVVFEVEGSFWYCNRRG